MWLKSTAAPPGALLLLIILSSACSGLPDERAIIGTKYLIDEIELEGVQRFDHDELLQYTHFGETSWVPLTPDFYFNEAFIPVDSRRIEALYAAHGYHHARVVSITPRFKGDDEVDLTITVEEGPQTKVRVVDYDWPAGPPSVPAGEELEASTQPPAIQRAARLETGETFEIPGLNAAVADMRVTLQQHGYALARVDEKAEVDRDALTADVRFTIVPGPFARIGRIHVEGLQMAPEYLVRREFDYAPGRRYSPTLVRRVEQSVYAMDVFRSVTVVPAKALTPEGALDLTVRVAEAQPQSLRLGFGFGFEPTRWEERITALYTHNNLGGDLERLDLRLRVGYAELPTPLDLIEHGPVVEIEPTFSKKGWVEKRLVWTARPNFELGVEQGYQFYTFSNAVSVSRFFFGHLQLEGSYNFRYFNVFDESTLFDAATTELGRDYRDPYLLYWVGLDTRLFLTREVLNPTDGVILDLEYAVAGGVLAGDFDFQRITPGLTAYWQPWERLQLAARAQVGFILGYGDHPGAPIDQRYALGGADTVRGWGLKRLSPQIDECEPDERCKGIPVGGDTQVLGNLEARVRAVGDLWIAAFGDVGDVREGEVVFNTDEWNYSTGLGARFDSPVGKFRLDFGYRLNEVERFAAEPRWALHLGLGEPF